MLRKKQSQPSLPIVRVTAPMEHAASELLEVVRKEREKEEESRTSSTIQYYNCVALKSRLSFLFFSFPQTMRSSYFPNEFRNERIYPRFAHVDKHSIPNHEHYCGYYNQDNHSDKHSDTITLAELNARKPPEFVSSNSI